MKSKFILLSILIFVFFSESIFSKGSESSESSNSNDSYSSNSNGETEDVNYLNGKDSVYKKDYKKGIQYLLKAAKKDPNNANVFNLLGYSHRKLDMNDKALGFYEKALTLDPRHLGAHEYIGELYLKLKKPDKAEYHLSKLDNICLFGCDQYDELKEAIRNYKNNK